MRAALGLLWACACARPGASAAVPWLSALSLGTDYYPEAYTPARIAEDAAAMQAAGLTTVRLAEFAWHRLQPAAGAPYNFSFLDEALAVLSAHGIRAILGTPTASPPQWLYKLDPSIALVDQNQQRVGTGSRQNLNHLHPLIISSTRDIVSAMAQHYANDTRVLAWQIDNEIHGEYDYSAITQAGFAAWLGAKYGSTDAMNAAWGTAFWGEEYDAFADVPLPWATPDCHNPGLSLDYRRFIAHVGASYLELQAGLLRRLAPGIPITHNCMGLYSNVDYSRFGRSLDAVSFDNYPLTWFGGGIVDYTRLGGGGEVIYGNAMQHAAMRAAKPGQSYFVMEHQVSNTGQGFYYGSGWAAGYRLAAWQSIANGADGIQFFRWRTSRFGQEQHWEGILNWDGQPAASPRHAAVAALAQEFAAASPHVFGGAVRASVAVLWSLETAWSLEEQPITQPAITAQPQMRGFLRAFRARGVNVDLVYISADAGNSSAAAPAPDLSPYTILIAPSLLVLPAALSAALAAFVQRGGALFLSMRSGAKGSDNAYVEATLPGALAPLVGALVLQWDPLCSLGEGGLSLAAGNFTVPLPPPFAATPLPLSTTQGRLCELLTPAAATPTSLTQVLARYSSGVMAGQPAATLWRDPSSSGSGKAIYSGTVSDAPEFYDLMARELASGSSTVTLLDAALPEGVESSVRHLASGARAVFALNWGGLAVNFTLPAAGGCMDTLGANITVSAEGGMVLPPYELAVFACPP